MNQRAYAAVTGMAATMFAGLFAFTARDGPQPRLLWNASASVAPGLYRVHPGDRIAVGDLVAIRPPAPLAHYMAQRHYLPLGLPLLKQVAAVGGATVCRYGDHLHLDGSVIAVARRRDRHGRHLPTWQGCRRLKAGDLFLLNPAADSFDGRYFGPLPRSGLIGRATPVLTRATADAPLVWRSDSRCAPNSLHRHDHPQGEVPCR